MRLPFCSARKKKESKSFGDARGVRLAVPEAASAGSGRLPRRPGRAARIAGRAPDAGIGRRPLGRGGGLRKGNAAGNVARRPRRGERGRRTRGELRGGAALLVVLHLKG